MKKSAGILLYKWVKREVEVFLVHPGGPFWKNKDLGSWSIPKGEIGENEEALATAKREFFEETGKQIDGKFIPLKSITQKSGKNVEAWAVEGDIDIKKIKSNSTTITWPPGTGIELSIPEIDKGKWFSLEVASLKINNAQQDFLQQLRTLTLP